VARATFQRALVIFEAAYVPDYPDVTRTRALLREIDGELGDS
jgi:hypothetical protein